MWIMGSCEDSVWWYPSSAQGSRWHVGLVQGCCSCNCGFSSSASAGPPTWSTGSPGKTPPQNPPHFYFPRFPASSSWLPCGGCRSFCPFPQAPESTHFAFVPIQSPQPTVLHVQGVEHLPNWPSWTSHSDERHIKKGNDFWSNNCSWWSVSGMEAPSQQTPRGEWSWRENPLYVPISGTCHQVPIHWFHPLST